MSTGDEVVAHLTEEQLLNVVMSGFKSGATTALANLTPLTPADALTAGGALSGLTMLDPATRQEMLGLAHGAAALTDTDTLPVPKRIKVQLNDLLADGGDQS